MGRTGKTTALDQLAETIELMCGERSGGPDRIPVVYVTVPPADPAEADAMEFARFLGLPPVRPAGTSPTSPRRSAGSCIDARCDLVCVDELHNLNLATRAGEDMSDTSNTSPSGCRPRSC